MSKKDIFYIHGYDPRSYRFYYQVFKNNLEEYKKNTGENIQISKINHNDKYKNFQIRNDELNVNYTFLEWNEVIKKYWSKTHFAIFKDYLYILFFYILSFKFIRFAKVYKISLIAGFYPVIYLSLVYFFSIFIIIYYFKILNFYFFLVFFISFLFLANKIIVFIGKKIAAFWLLNICVFAAKYSKNEIKSIDLIIKEFSKEIINKLKENQNTKDYELILISHSVGTIININVLSEVIKKCEELKLDYSKLKILTLGECIPLCSLYDFKNNFNKDLKFLSNKKIIWFDFTSKIDGACFYLVDFFKVSKLQSNSSIIFYSAAFYKLYDKKYYKKIMRKWYQVHFMYLFATHYLGRYNFFAFVTNKDLLENKIKG